MERDLPASRWETFLASVMAVFAASDESFSGWLKKRRLFIGQNMRVYRVPASSDHGNG
jgi:hypothetical protein